MTGRPRRGPIEPDENQLALEFLFGGDPAEQELPEAPLRIPSATSPVVAGGAAAAAPAADAPIPVPPSRFASRPALHRFIADAGVGSAEDVFAFLRSNRESGLARLDAGQRAMALAAVAGRRPGGDFDLDAARAALARLSDGDTTLPANAVGRRISFTEDDPADQTIVIRGGRPAPRRQRPVTGRVLRIEPDPGARLRLIVERDMPSPEGWPRAVLAAPADAHLAAVPPLHREAPQVAAASPSQANLSQPARQENQTQTTTPSPARAPDAAELPDPGILTRRQIDDELSSLFTETMTRYRVAGPHPVDGGSVNDTLHQVAPVEMARIAALQAELEARADGGGRNGATGGAWLAAELHDRRAARNREFTGFATDDWQAVADELIRYGEEIGDPSAARAGEYIRLAAGDRSTRPDRYDTAAADEVARGGPDAAREHAARLELSADVLDAAGIDRNAFTDVPRAAGRRDFRVEGNAIQTQLRDRAAALRRALDRAPTASAAGRAGYLAIAGADRMSPAAGAVLNEMMAKLIVLAPSVSPDGKPRVLDMDRAQAFLDEIMDSPIGTGGERKRGAIELSRILGQGGQVPLRPEDPVPGVTDQPIPAAPAQVEQPPPGGGREPYMDKPGAVRVALAEDQRHLAGYRFEDVLAGDQAYDDWFGGYMSPDGQALLVHDRAAVMREITNAVELIDDNLDDERRNPTADREQVAQWRAERRKWDQVRRRVERAVPEGFRLDAAASTNRPGRGDPEAPGDWAPEPDGPAADAAPTTITVDTGRSDEQPRSTGDAALATVAAGPVRRDPEPGEVLHRAGRAGRDTDRGAERRAGGERPAGRDVPGQAGPAQRGPAAGRGDRGPRVDPAGAGRLDRPDARPGLDPARRGPEPSVLGRPGEVAALAAATRFAPSGQQDLAPSGSVARVRANLAAVATLRLLQREQRPATPAEQAVLARWSGWGAVPEVFEHERFAWAREQLGELLDPAELAAAQRNTLNAHYTDLGLVRHVWTALERMGFGGGRVLEPGCGSGNFIAAAPARTQVVGVELDPVTAGIAAALYPDAQVLAESFADTRAPAGSFDLAVGNVPFGRVALTDPAHNRGSHSIHNHFIIKSLHLVAPGGLVAVITSRYTLDAANPSARREIAQLADLVGAVRLPEAAHQRAAGTKVVTDLLVLRRREPGRAPAPVTGWERTREVEIDGEQVGVNEYFLARPEMVCGQLRIGRGEYRADLTVVGDRPAGELLATALDTLVTDAATAGLRHSPDPAAAAEPQRAALVGRSVDRAEGYLQVDGDGFTRLDQGIAAPYLVPRSQAEELRALLGLRDCALELLHAEAESLDSTETIDRLRAELNQRYDAYAARFGPVNRFTWRRTGRTDPDTGEERLARQRPNQGGFRADPHAPVVYALEQFDPVQQKASKADIFTQRVVAPRAPRLGADTPADALAICLDVHGRVDLDEIARLLGTSTEDARAGLGTLVFDDPAAGRLVPAAEYLSGNVRDRLAAARAAAQDDPRFAVNVAALTEAVPPDIQPEDIVARLGSAWIDADVVQQFLRETLDDAWVIVEHPYGAVWVVKGADRSVAATSTWGTPDLPAPQLAQALLTQRAITVHDEIEFDLPGGGTTTRRVLNLGKTVAAQAKADELAARFSEWVWEDPARAGRLARVYNDRFNSTVLRSYDDAQLSLPGLALTFRPRPHQVAAVARMIAEPAVGLYHEVGAGKTAEMAMGAMELRRLGLVSKPAVVVPNHMLEQFAREWLQLYPQAKLLTASTEDLTRERRRGFIARVATGDWDAVIMTQKAFEKIPMSPKAEAAYLNSQLEVLRAAIEQQRGSGQRSFSLKRMEQTLLNAQERIKQKLAGDHDPAVTFEHTGIDYVIVDEAHLYKNLRTASNIPGAGIDGANRASDLEMKLHYLRGRHGGRVATFATATPIANSITEAHVMQRYLRPDLLEAAGVLDFDVWAATFGQTTTEVELAPDGGRFRLKSRFARFHNVPELLRMWHVSGDIKTAEDLRLPTPALVARPGDGARDAQTIVVPPTPELERYIAELGARADAVAARRVEPDVDNMLKIAGDGRRAALDLRLVGLTAPPGESKVDQVAQRMLAIWAAHRDDRFTTPDGEPHAVPGALQLAFCDISTPAANRWNVYDQLRAQLVAGGIPAEQVRFVHEARNDQEKAELFAAARAGRIAVLLGSTERMGVGTNVQLRARALHHIDCPWRPADLQQRDGRILRQGNQYPEVEIYRYVTERSFDAYSWQTVARKAQFIAQVMRGRLDVREIEDIGDNALSFNEVKALSSGNPLVLDKARADADLTRLERLERAHAQTRTRLRDVAAAHERTIADLEPRIAALDTALRHRRDTRGDKFAMTVAGRLYDSRAAAGEALRELLLTALQQPGERHDLAPVELGGLRFNAHTVRSYTADDGYYLQLGGLEVTAVPGTATELDAANPVSLVVRLENRLADLDRTRARIQAEVDSARAEIARATQEAAKPFAHTDALSAARARVEDLDAQLAALAPDPTGVETLPAAVSEVDPTPGPAAATAHPASAAATALAPPPGPRRAAPSVPTRPRSTPPPARTAPIKTVTPR